MSVIASQAREYKRIKLLIDVLSFFVDDNDYKRKK